jgi:hypothetical protein
MKKKSKANPRHPWEFYGLDKMRQKELTALMESGKYVSMLRSAANMANKQIAAYLIKSVTEKRSYDRLEFDNELGRIPCGRTDFYGIRRYFYHLFDLKLKKIIYLQSYNHRPADHVARASFHIHQEPVENRRRLARSFRA